MCRQARDGLALHALMPRRKKLRPAGPASNGGADRSVFLGRFGWAATSLATDQRVAAQPHTVCRDVARALAATRSIDPACAIGRESTVLSQLHVLQDTIAASAARLRPSRQLFRRRSQNFYAAADPDRQ